MGDCKMMMRRTLVLVAVVAGMATASPVAADPRDSVDRGDRLDTDALRDDVSINRLKVPSHPLVITPPGRTVTTSKGAKGRKPGASGNSSR
jgi:hypothetical protein